MKCYPPPPPLPYHAYAHLPHHGKMFCAKERRIFFGPLGVISYYSMNPIHSVYTCSIFWYIIFVWLYCTKKLAGIIVDTYTVPKGLQGSLCTTLLHQRACRGHCGHLYCTKELAGFIVYSYTVPKSLQGSLCTALPYRRAFRGHCVQPYCT